MNTTVYCRESGATRPSASGFGRGQRPVINRLNDATAYCNWLSEREKLPKHMTMTETC